MDYDFMKDQALDAMKAMGHELPYPDICRNSGKLAAAFLEADKQREELLKMLEHFVSYETGIDDQEEAKALVAKCRGRA